LAFKSAEEKPDINQALERIKAGKYTDLAGKEHKVYEGLTEFYKHFENKEKLVKLVGWEEKFKAVLKAEIEKKDPVENLSD
jgi:predicted phosphatase